MNLFKLNFGIIKKIKMRMLKIPEINGIIIQFRFGFFLCKVGSSFISYCPPLWFDV